MNQLAANLTTQLRAIADVATAVTKGDLTRSIQVAAQGEVAFVKDNINEMIRNLRDTTLRNNEQDWLKTNLAKFTRMLQGQKDLLTVGRMILSELAPVVSAQQGVFYIMDGTRRSEPELKLLASYAYRERKGVNNRFRLGEGLVGQAALEKERILLTQRAGRLRPDQLRPWRSAAEEHRRAPDPVRGPGQGGDGTFLGRALQSDAPGVPRSAHGKHRHRSEHDRGEHADGRSR